MSQVDPTTALRSVGFVQSKNFASAAANYRGVIRQSENDPQKVGKGIFSYSSAETFVELALVRYRQQMQRKRLADSTIRETNWLYLGFLLY